MKNFFNNLLYITLMLIWAIILMASVILIINNVAGMLGIILAVVVFSIEVVLSLIIMAHFLIKEIK